MIKNSVFLYKLPKKKPFHSKCSLDKINNEKIIKTKMLVVWEVCLNISKYVAAAAVALYLCNNNLSML